MKRNLVTFNSFENIMNASFEMVQFSTKGKSFCCERASDGQNLQKKIAKDFQDHFAYFKLSMFSLSFNRLYNHEIQDRIKPI